ncbi:MAG: RimK family alpha-L-glutamate ligase [Saprospiraceae bacterium]
MNIAILSRGPQLYSTQSLFRAGRRRGHFMHLLDHARCNLVMEDGQFRILDQGRILPPIDAVIPRIGASVTNIGAAVIAHFENMDVFTVATSEALLRARDKMRCLQYLQRKGLPIPTTVLVGNTEELPILIDRIGGFPIVIKLLESTHGAGVLLSHTLANAKATIEAFHRLNERVTIQEFIREAHGADLRAFIVDGEIVASMKRQALEGEFRSNLHRGASASVELLTEQEQDIVLRAAEVMGLAVAGVDILRSDRGPLIMEVNASPGLEGIEKTTDVDIAGKIINYVERGVRSKTVL